MKFAHGLAFPDSDRFMVAQTTAQGDYQASHIKAALTFVTGAQCAVDAGAHIGTWTRRLAASFARVLAFEPSPDTVECLRVNTQELPNVEVRQEALGVAPGFVRMALDADQEARANTGARYVKTGGDIPVVALDTLRLEALDFFKLDVEGSELFALQGAEKTLKRCRPIVLFEDKGLWKRYGQGRQAVSAYLTTLGYRHLCRVSCDEIWGPR